MEVGAFLTALRDHHLDQFGAFVAEQRALYGGGAAEVAVQMRPESAIYGHRYRVDYLADGSQGPVVREMVPDDILAFDRVTLPMGAVYVSIGAMSWDDVVIGHDLDALPDDAIAAWFDHWFDADGRRQLAGDGWSGAIHSLLAGDDRLGIDLGTAPVDALLDMLALLAGAGARTLTIAGSRGDDHADPETV